MVAVFTIEVVLEAFDGFYGCLAPMNSILRLQQQAIAALQIRRMGQKRTGASPQSGTNPPFDPPRPKKHILQQVLLATKTCCDFQRPNILKNSLSTAEGYLHQPSSAQ